MNLTLRVFILFSLCIPGARVWAGGDPHRTFRHCVANYLGLPSGGVLIYGGEPYRISKVIGRGGQSRVIRARRLDPDPPYTPRENHILKVFKASRRSRALAQREHDLILEVRKNPGARDGVPEVEGIEDSRLGPTISFKEIPGARSLLEVIQGGAGPRAPRQVTGLIAQAARVLQSVHDAGVVHRDVKPGNFLVTPEGKVVLIDFGLAMRPAEEGAELERARSNRQTVGTPFYKSPELAVRKSYRARDDVWALVISLYEGVTGRFPFTGFSEPDLEGTLAQFARGEVSPEIPSTLSPGLQSVFRRAFQADPDLRFQTAKELADALDACR